MSANRDILLAAIACLRSARIYLADYEKEFDFSQEDLRHFQSEIEKIGHQLLFRSELNSMRQFLKDF